MLLPFARRLAFAGALLLYPSYVFLGAFFFMRSDYSMVDSLGGDIALAFAAWLIICGVAWVACLVGLARGRAWPRAAFVALSLPAVALALYLLLPHFAGGGIIPQMPSEVGQWRNGWQFIAPFALPLLLCWPAAVFAGSQPWSRRAFAGALALIGLVALAGAALIFANSTNRFCLDISHGDCESLRPFATFALYWWGPGLAASAAAWALALVQTMTRARRAERPERRRGFPWLALSPLPAALALAVMGVATLHARSVPLGASEHTHLADVAFWLAQLLPVWPLVVLALAWPRPARRPAIEVATMG